MDKIFGHRANCSVAFCLLLLGHRQETTSGPVDVVEPTLEGYDDIEPRNEIGLFRKVLQQKVVHTTPTQREFLQWEYTRSLKNEQCDGH